MGGPLSASTPLPFLDSGQGLTYVHPPANNLCPLHSEAWFRLYRRITSTAFQSKGEGMSDKTWRAAVKAIDTTIGSPTPKQKKLAAIAGISLPPTLPSIVAAAWIRTALSKEIRFDRLARARYDTVDLIEEMWTGSKTRFTPPNTQEEASAWIEYLYLHKRRSSLKKLRPNEGDVVVTASGAYGEVSSIGEDGRLYFKGGGGFGAWPDRVTVVARVRDKSAAAEEARKTARNAASTKKPTSSWSVSKHEDLSEFEVIGTIADADVDALETVINTAQDERAIQQYLNAKPHLLATLLQRTPRYVVSQKRLGSEFVTDFVGSDVDSMGIHWYLIELENPTAPVYLKDRKTLSAEARKGIDQVVEWRNWLQDNIAYARQPRAQNGLGLFDIRPDTRALVLVGRRSTLDTTTDAARRELRASSNIHVHTYDWLLESIRGAMTFSGPSAFNSHSLYNLDQNLRAPRDP